MEKKDNHIQNKFHLVLNQKEQQHRDQLTSKQKAISLDILSKFETELIANKDISKTDPFLQDTPFDGCKSAKTMFHGPFMNEIYNQFLLGHLEPDAFSYLRNFPKLYFTLPEPKNAYIKLILNDIQKKITQTQKKQLKKEKQLKEQEDLEKSEEPLPTQPIQQQQQQKKKSTNINQIGSFSDSDDSDSSESDSELESNAFLQRPRQERQLLRKTLEMSQFQSKQIVEEKKSQAIIEEKLKKFQFKENYQPQKIKARSQINKLRKQVKDNILLRQNNHIYDENIGKKKTQQTFNSKLFRNLDEFTTEYAKKNVNNRQFKKKFLGNQCIITEAKSNFVANGANSSVNNRISESCFQENLKKSDGNMAFKHQKQFFKRFLTENADKYIEAIQDPFQGKTRDEIQLSDYHYQKLVSRYLNKVEHEKMKDQNRKNNISDLQAYIKTGIREETDPLEQRKKQYEKIYLENISDVQNFDSDFIIHTENTENLYHPKYKDTLTKKFTGPQPVTISSFKDYNNKVFQRNMKNALTSPNLNKNKKKESNMSHSFYNGLNLNVSKEKESSHSNSMHNPSMLKSRKNVQINVQSSRTSKKTPSIKLHSALSPHQNNSNMNNNNMQMSSQGGSHNTLQTFSNQMGRSMQIQQQKSILLNSNQKNSNSTNNVNSGSLLKIDNNQNNPMLMSQQSKQSRKSKNMDSSFIMGSSGQPGQKRGSHRPSFQGDQKSLKKMQSSVMGLLSDGKKKRSKSKSPKKGQKKVNFFMEKQHQNEQKKKKEILQQYHQKQQEKQKNVQQHFRKEKIKSKGFNRIERNDNYSERSGSNDSDNASQTEGYLNYLYEESQDLQNKLQASTSKESLIKKLKFIMRLEENKTNINLLNMKKLTSQ